MKRYSLFNRTFDMLFSSAIVYLVTPMLQKALAPIQAQLNANAVNAGQIPTTQGLSQVANQMVSLIPDPNPTPASPIFQDSAVLAVVDNPTIP